MPIVALALAAALAFGCAADSLAREDFADAVLATAVRVREGNPDVTVQVLNRGPNQAPPAAEPLGWDPRQALTTAGFELVEEPAPGRSEDAVLSIGGARFEDGAWHVTATLHRLAPPGHHATEIEWRVDCSAGPCTVSDSMPGAPDQGG